MKKKKGKFKYKRKLEDDFFGEVVVQNKFQRLRMKVCVQQEKKKLIQER